MAYLGMFAIGGFVGGLLTLGLSLIEGWSGFTKAITFILGAAFSGVVMQVIDKFGGSQIGSAIYTYPLGLLIALLWFYGHIAMANINEQGNRSRQIVGWGHVVGLVAINVTAAALVLPPAFRDVWDYLHK